MRTDFRDFYMSKTATYDTTCVKFLSVTEKPTNCFIPYNITKKKKKNLIYSKLSIYYFRKIARMFEHFGMSMKLRIFLSELHQKKTKSKITVTVITKKKPSSFFRRVFPIYLEHDEENQKKEITP